MKPGIAILALIVTFLFSPLSLADKGPVLKDYPAEQVTENVYVMTALWSSIRAPAFRPVKCCYASWQKYRTSR